MVADTTPQSSLRLASSPYTGEPRSALSRATVMRTKILSVTPVNPLGVPAPLTSKGSQENGANAIPCRRYNPSVKPLKAERLDSSPYTGEPRFALSSPRRAQGSREASSVSAVRSCAAGALARSVHALHNHGAADLFKSGDVRPRFKVIAKTVFLSSPDAASFCSIPRALRGEYFLFNFSRFPAQSWRCRPFQIRQCSPPLQGHSQDRILPPP